MKKILILALLIGTTSFAFFGCKKGDKDPFFTIKSRQGRLTGKWQVTTWTVNEVDQLVTNDTSSVPAGGGCPGQTKTTTTTLDPIYTFDKSGEFEFRIKTTVATSNVLYHAQGTCVADASTSVDSVGMMEGVWMFGGGVGEFKNKEQLVLTDHNHIFGEIWDIVELKSKEITIEFDETDLTTGNVVKTVMVMKHMKD